MTPAQIITALVQAIQIAQELTPLALKAIEDFKALFADGNEPTQADIDALIATINEQSAQIQAIN